MPLVDLFDGEEHGDTSQQRVASRLRQPDEQEAGVGPWRVASRVAEVEILSDEKAAGTLRCLPDVRIVSSRQTLLMDGIDVVPKSL
jgi:hypothetical protein